MGEFCISSYYNVFSLPRYTCGFLWILSVQHLSQIYLGSLLSCLFFLLLYSVLRNPRFCLLGAYRHLFYSHSLFHWAWELKHAEYRTLDKHITLSKTDPTLQCLCWLHIHYYSLYNHTCLPACLPYFILPVSLSSSFLPSLPLSPIMLLPHTFKIHCISRTQCS